MDLSQIEIKLNKIKPFLSKAVEIILSEDVSRYPIFILSEAGINLGIPLLEKDDTIELDWNVNLSTLEEFYVKKMIEADKIETFKAAYKSTETHLCIFLLTENNGQYIFLPK